MLKFCLYVLFTSCLVAVASVKAESPLPANAKSSSVVINDAEVITQWSSDQGKLFLSDEASQGKHSVGIEIDRPVEVKMHLVCQEDLSSYDLIVFDYKLTGPVDYIDMVIRQRGLNGGRRGQYYPLDQADIKGQWASKTLPLRGPENLSLNPGENWAEGGNEFYFAFTPKPGVEPVRLLIDNIRVLKNPFKLPAITFGSWDKQADGGVSYQYQIPIVNPHDQPIVAHLDLETNRLSKFAAKLASDTMDVPAHGQVVFKVTITIPAASVKEMPAYYGEEAAAILSVDGQDTSLKTRLVAAVPPKGFVHPSVPGNIEQISSLADRIKQYPELAKIWKTVLAQADQEVNKPTQVPDYSGAGVNRCYEDGTMLKLITRRPGIAFNEYMCSKCGRVYSGRAFDSKASLAGEWNSPDGHMHLSKRTLACAFVYRVTGDIKYGKRVEEILQGYNEKYFTYDEAFYQDPSFPLGDESPSPRRIGGIHFVENQWMKHMATAFDLLHGTPVLTDGTAQAFKKIMRYTAQRSTSNEIGYNNIQLMGSVTQMLVGLALEDPVLVYFGIYERRGAASNLDYNLLIDGTWGESCSYNCMVGGMLPSTLYLAKQLGADLYDTRAIKFFTQWPKAANPEGILPYFGDGPAGPVSQWGMFASLPYYHTKKPELASVLNQFPGQSPRDYDAYLYLMAYDGPPVATPNNATDKKNDSLVFEGAGYAFLNNPRKLWMGLIYGPQLGHGHYDRLSFEFYGGNALQVVDGGASAYGSKPYSEFQRYSLAHNTITVDGKNQYPAPGRLLQFTVDGEVKCWQLVVINWPTACGLNVTR